MNSLKNKTREKKLGGLFLSFIPKMITGLFLLSWLVALVFFFVYPLWPKVQMQVSQMHQYYPYNVGYNATVQFAVRLMQPSYDDEKTDAVQSSKSRTIESIDEESATIAHLEEDSVELVIPSAGVDGMIVDGLSQDAMLRGFWHYPTSSVPGERGNTVIIGHRFDKLPPRTDTFFNLDMVSVGDSVTIRGDSYRDISYTVISKKVVEKDDFSVVKQTGDFRLTLITCTPVWTSEKRLVVVALQDEVHRVI